MVYGLEEALRPGDRRRCGEVFYYSETSPTEPDVGEPVVYRYSRDFEYLEETL
jgi:hypothetical protein